LQAILQMNSNLVAWIDPSGAGVPSAAAIPIVMFIYK